MSRTWKGPNGTVFIFNSDLSGRVSYQAADGRSGELDGADLAFFARDFVASECIAHLEQHDFKAALTLLIGVKES